MPVFGVAPTSQVLSNLMDNTLLSNRIIHDFRHAEKELKPLAIFALSIAGHLILVGIIVMAMYLAAIFGWNMIQFERPELADTIEFQLVEAPEELPEKKTNIVSNQNSRAGGKVDTPHPKQALKAAGKPKATLVKSTAKPVHNASPTPHPNRAPAVTKPQSTKAPAKPQAVSQQPAAQPAAPKAPRPRASQPTAPKASTMAGPPNPSRISLRPNTTGIIAAPASGGNGAGPVKSGPIVGGLPSVGGHGSGSGTGASGSGGQTGPSFTSGQFSKRPGGNAGGGNGPQGQQGNGGTHKANQAGGGTQAGNGHGTVNARKAVNWDEYIRRLQNRIHSQWKPPSGLMSSEFALTIARDGRLVSKSLKTTSGDQEFDNSCRLAIERAAPFAPLPPEWDKNKINIEFTCKQHEKS